MLGEQRSRRRWRRAAAVAAALCLSAGALPGVARSQQDAGPPLTGEELQRARARELAQLELRIGRYASGEAAVYSGALAVTERRLGPDARRLPRGRVVAALTREVPGDGRGHPEIALTIVSAEAGLWLRLGQAAAAPDVTRSTLLRPVGAGGGVTGTCRGCLPDLSAAPRALGFRRFAAAGTLGDAGGSAFRVEISGQLERVPPSDLELADLERLNVDFEAARLDESEPFVRRAGEGVRRVERELRERVPPPAGAPPQTRCERVVRYAAVRFVDLENLSRFGVRRLRRLESRICCFDHDGHGGGERCAEASGP